MTSSPELLRFFHAEANEYLDALAGLVLDDDATPDASAFVAAARAMRGSATMARVQRVADLAFTLEQIGNALREGELTWSVVLQQELLDRFGGVTSVQRQFPLQGVWQSGPDVYHDRVVIFSVMDFRNETQLECLRYLGRLKGRLKKKFDQLEILITVAELLAI